jgi:hypothetical protein
MIPSPLAGEGGAHRVSDGKVRGNAPRHSDRRLAASPLTLPLPDEAREIWRGGSE